MIDLGAFILLVSRVFPERTRYDESLQKTPRISKISHLDEVAYLQHH